MLLNLRKWRWSVRENGSCSGEKVVAGEWRKKKKEWMNIIAGSEERENKMLRKTFAQLTHAPTPIPTTLLT